MKRLATALVLLCLSPAAALARRPILVELFTAQGCATCSKANTAVARWVGRPDAIVLTWSVDYWDYLGWKDTFAKTAFSERQRAYDKRFGLRDVSTPQLVVDGAAEGSGDRAEAVDDLIRKARREKVAPPQVAWTSAGKIAVGSGRRPSGGGDVWLARFAPAEQTVDVRAGDNRGATVIEQNVVRELTRLGSWSGRPTIYRVPPSPEDGLSSVVIVQRSGGGSVLAAAVKQAN